MCILFLTVNANPIPGGYKLILASNRDEFYSRPASYAAQWEKNHANHDDGGASNDGIVKENLVFGGRDLEHPAMGTWLAMGVDETKQIFRIGALLNLTGEPKRTGALGRGPLVANYVAGNINNVEYSNRIINGEDIYNSFNMVSVEIDAANKTSSVVHTSNAPHETIILPENDCYGFGNSHLEVPLQKVKYGAKMFKEKISKANDIDRSRLTENLLEVLSHKDKYWPDDELKRRAPKWGEHLSRICVKMPEAGYGTRTKTIILIDSENRVDFYEETLTTADPDGDWHKTNIVRDFF